MARDKNDRLLTEIDYKMLKHPEWYKKGDPWRGWIEHLRKGLKEKKLYLVKRKPKFKIPTNTVQVWKRATKENTASK